MGNKIIAAYIRISHEDTDIKTNESKRESNSIGNQRKYIQEYIKKHDFCFERVREFVDDGYSGTNFNRPKVKELIELCRQGKVECIIVKDFSRFGRNYIELGDYLEQLFPFLGIRFISINDQYDSLNLNGVTGGVGVAFQNLIYELYSRDLSKKSYSSLGTLMRKGTYLPGAAPFGYRNDREHKTLIPDKEAADIVKRIFSEVAGGKGAAEVAWEFNLEGVSLPIDFKRKNGEYLNRKYNEVNQWNRQKIIRIIRNEKYMGTMVYRTHKSISVGSEIRRKQAESNWIRIEDHHESIVDREVFEQANANIKRVSYKGRKAYDEKRKNLFVCGYCKHRLVKRNTKSPYFKCQNALIGKDVNCNKISINEAEVYDIIMEKIKQQEQKKCSPPRMIQKQKETNVTEKNRRMEQIRQEIRQLEEKSILLYESLKSGALGKESFIEQKGIISGSKECLVEEQILLEKGLMGIQVSIEEDEPYLLRPEGINVGVDAKEQIIRNWVKEVVVFSDKQVEIVWKDI